MVCISVFTVQFASALPKMRRNVWCWGDPLNTVCLIKGLGMPVAWGPGVCVFECVCLCVCVLMLACVSMCMCVCGCVCVWCNSLSINNI